MNNLFTGINKIILLNYLYYNHRMGAISNWWLEIQKAEIDLYQSNEINFAFYSIRKHYSDHHYLKNSSNTSVNFFQVFFHD